MNTNELYTISFITKSFPTIPVAKSTTANNVITANDIQKVEQKILQAVDNEVNAKKTKGANIFR